MFFLLKKAYKVCLWGFFSINICFIVVILRIVGIVSWMNKMIMKYMSTNIQIPIVALECICCQPLQVVLQLYSSIGPKWYLLNIYFSFVWTMPVLYRQCEGIMSCILWVTEESAQIVGTNNNQTRQCFITSGLQSIFGIFLSWANKGLLTIPNRV